jgi:hypothetical protein
MPGAPPQQNMTQPDEQMRRGNGGAPNMINAPQGAHGF